MILRSSPSVLTTLNEQDRHREQLLSNLLEFELRESVEDFLSRTRRSFPLYYVFRLPDTEA